VTLEQLGDVAVVRLARETVRTRRLQPGEEERLLAAATNRPGGWEGVRIQLALLNMAQVQSQLRFQP